MQTVPRGPSILSIKGVDKSKPIVEVVSDYRQSIKTIKASFTADLNRLLMGDSELFILYNQNKNAAEAEITKENVRDMYSAIRDKLKKHDKKGVPSSKLKPPAPSGVPAVYYVDSLPPGMQCYLVASLYRQAYVAPLSTLTESATSLHEFVTSTCAKM